MELGRWHSARMPTGFAPVDFGPVAGRAAFARSLRRLPKGEDLAQSPNGKLVASR